VGGKDAGFRPNPKAYCIHVQFALTVQSAVADLSRGGARKLYRNAWDPTFSEHSNGFRPGRSAWQAVHQAQQYVAEGHCWVVSLDFRDFDCLTAPGGRARVADRRMLRLIRAFSITPASRNALHEITKSQL
jgi:hypothetical protein